MPLCLRVVLGVFLCSPRVQFWRRGFQLATTFENSTKGSVYTGGTSLKNGVGDFFFLSRTKEPCVYAVEILTTTMGAGCYVLSRLELHSNPRR